MKILIFLYRQNLLQKFVSNKLLLVSRPLLEKKNKTKLGKSFFFDFKNTPGHLQLKLLRSVFSLCFQAQFRPGHKT